MSGHSKWANIKHKKAATDKKRAGIFAKLAKSISVAASLGGGDPETNYTLRTEIEKAKSLNLPKDKIERAIQKGTGESKDSAQLKNLQIEAYGPGNVALIIEAITDNSNRTTSEVKNILTKNGGKFAGEGSVSWMFTHSGVLRVPKENIKDSEEFELQAIDAGAQDIETKDEEAVIYTKIENLQKAHLYMEEAGYKNISSAIEWVVKDEIEISDSDQGKLEKLFEALDENEDVQEIYSNEQ